MKDEEFQDAVYWERDAGKFKQCQHPYEHLYVLHDFLMR